MDIWEDYEYEDWYNETLRQRRINLINYLSESSANNRSLRRWQVHPIF